MKRVVKSLLASARTLWLAGGIALAGLLLLEGLLFGLSVLGVLGQESSLPESEDRPDSQLAYRRELASALRLEWDPETCWDFPAVQGTYINVDGQGRRKTWSDPRTSATPEIQRIWCFGGSTLWGFGSRDDHTLPSEIARLLAADGHVVQIDNYAVPGYVLAQECSLYLRRLRFEEPPDLVVFFDGYNDLVSAFVNQEAGVPLWNYHYQQGMRTRLWHASGTYRVGRQLLWQHLPALVTEAGPPHAKLNDLAQQAVDDYLQRTALITTVNRSLGIRTLFFWQPTLFDKPQRSNREMEIYHELGTVQIGNDSFYTSTENLADFFAASKRALAARVSSVDASIVDLAESVRSQNHEVFFDGCHLIEPANVLIARPMAAAIEEILFGDPENQPPDS